MWVLVVRLRQTCWHLYSTESSEWYLRPSSRKLVERAKVGFYVQWRARSGQAECFEAADEELKFFFFARAVAAYDSTKVGRILGSSAISSLVRPWGQSSLWKFFCGSVGNRKFQVSRPTYTFDNVFSARKGWPCHPDSSFHWQFTRGSVKLSQQLQERNSHLDIEDSCHEIRMIFILCPLSWEIIQGKPLGQSCWVLYPSSQTRMSLGNATNNLKYYVVWTGIGIRPNSLFFFEGPGYLYLWNRKCGSGNLRQGTASRPSSKQSCFIYETHLQDIGSRRSCVLRTRHPHRSA